MTTKKIQRNYMSFEDWFLQDYLQEQHTETESIRINASFDHDIAAEIIRLAEKLDMSRSAMVAYLVESALRDRRESYQGYVLTQRANDPNDPYVTILESEGESK